jgi:pilus assembly protein Flp/PilA
MKKLMKSFIRDEEGATAVEYGVLIALIIAVCIIVIAAIGTQVNEAFSKVNSILEDKA